MAKKHFLGKTIPKRPEPEVSHGNHFLSWSLYLIIPFLIAFSVLYYLAVNIHTIDADSLTQNEQVTKTTLGSIPYQTIQEKAITVTKTATKTTIDCNVAIGDSKLDANTVFPIIPPELSNHDDSRCPPAQWNLNVLRYFSYKALTVANWLAATLAVLFTVWAGILYISGFASEQNTKKAKAILIGAYVGLLIVILARTILYGSIQATIDKDYDPNVTPVDTSQIIK